MCTWWPLFLVAFRISHQRYISLSSGFYYSLSIFPFQYHLTSAFNAIKFLIFTLEKNYECCEKSLATQEFYLSFRLEKKRDKKIDALISSSTISNRHFLHLSTQHSPNLRSKKNEKKNLVQVIFFFALIGNLS